MLRRIAVFASAAEVPSPAELTAARQVGQTLPERSITLVTAGGTTGPAGTLVDVALNAGGRVVAVVVEPADAEPPAPRPAYTELRRVDDADRQRREILILADAVLALPGAFERLEDVLALWHSVTAGSALPIGLLDDGGYYSGLVQRAGDEALDQFVRESQRGMLVLSRQLDDVLARLAEFRPPETRRALVADSDL